MTEHEKEVWLLMNIVIPTDRIYYDHVKTSKKEQMFALATLLIFDEKESVTRDEQNKSWSVSSSLEC